MSLSFFCFVINFSSVELKNLDKKFKPKFPQKYFGIFSIIIGAVIFMMWMGRIIPSINSTPPGLDHYTTLVIQALDLGFIVPVAILSGVLLIKRKSLGYLLGSVVIIKGVTMLSAVTMMIVFMLLSGVDVQITEIIVFPLFAIICIINFFILLKNITEQETV